jgi:putative tryptophan/tyrosine transport system substrate-binding protein
MRRRDFITVPSGATVAWPLALRAQQRGVPVVGYVSAGTEAEQAAFVAQLRRTLSEGGFIEGRNIAIEFLWAEMRPERYAALVGELVQRRVTVIMAVGGSPLALAAKAATTAIPIVFSIGADTVAVGLVKSLNLPGGNITGVTLDSPALLSKQVDLLRKLVPGASEFAYLSNPANLVGNARAVVDQAAHWLGWKVTHFTAQSAEFERAFVNLDERKISALLVQDDPIFNNNPQQLAVLAASHRIAALYFFREHPQAGSFASYGPNRLETRRQASLYVTRILKGEKPADLPVQQPSKFEFVINLKTAKAIGLSVPPDILAVADEVIE